MVDRPYIDCGVRTKTRRIGSGPSRRSSETIVPAGALVRSHVPEGSTGTVTPWPSQAIADGAPARSGRVEGRGVVGRQDRGSRERPRIGTDLVRPRPDSAVPCPPAHDVR